MKFILFLAGKQVKLSHRKPACIHWKADAPKTSHCLVRILILRHNWVFFFVVSKERLLQSMALVIGPCWTNFWSQKFKRRILATFGFNRTALRATPLDILRPVFEDHIISRRADVVWPPRSCNLTTLDYYLWGAVKDECYADKKRYLTAPVLN